MPKNKFVSDLHSGEIQLSPYAFSLREGELYLSASWIEKAGNNRVDCIVNTVELFRETRNIKAKDGFALGMSGEIKSCCRVHGRVVRILNEPDTKNPNYTAVRGIGPNALLLMEKLAADSWSEIVMNAVSRPRVL